jgi:YesN/AraC family two-component response regulator
MLISTPRTIKDITYSVGYREPSYFCKAFRKHFGKSPGDLRAENLP